MTVLGTIGLGLVWGWLAGAWAVSPRVVIALSATTLLAAIEVGLLVGARSVPVYLVAAALALVLRIAWLRELRSRSDRSALGSARGGRR